MNTAHSRKRFEALDAWRGIAACLIVYHHYHMYGITHLQDIPFVSNIYIAVDFFFVLSGFVIATSYKDKLAQGYPLKDYMLLRWARLYPLHLLTLLAFVALELSKYAVPSAEPPFSTEFKSLPSLGANLLLIQSLGLFSDLTWNFPSWSISAEFYTYIVFGLLACLLRGRMLIVSFFITLAAILFLWSTPHETIGVTYDYGFIRCLGGFCAGVICHTIYKFLNEQGFGQYFGTVAEILILVLVVLYINYCGGGQASFFAPVVFSAAVIIFAFDAGIISRCLRARAFQLVGLLSYSIYMIHAVFYAYLGASLQIAQKALGIDLHGTYNGDETPREIWGFEYWQGDLIFLTCLTVIIGISFVTYNLIEKPCNLWMRKKVGGKSTATGASASTAAW